MANLEYPIDVYGLRRKVFNHTVAKTYLGLKEIAQFKTYDEGYQRKRDVEHENKIIEYLKNSSNRYLPDIIIAIRHPDMNFGDKYLLNNNHFHIAKIKAYGILRVWFWTEHSLDNIKIIDGNHRISAIKRLLRETPESELADFEIGVTFIFSNDTQNDFENELALFYYLNSKSKPLLPNDYLNDATKELSDAKAKEIDWWMYVFKKSNVRLSDIFSEYITDKQKLQNNIVSACDYLAQKIQKDDIETMPIFFDMLSDIVHLPLVHHIIIEFVKKNKLYNLINIIFFIFLKDNNISTIAKETHYFYDWLKNHAKLTEFDEFENLYQTYKETYVSQDYKIFVAMEFYQQDDVFSAIKGTIEKVAKDMKLPLDCIRIDKVEKGNTYEIMNEILEQIQDNRLLIADITNKNANVYLEVGYAMGLAKSKGIENQIMFFIKTDEDGDANVGFDLQSYQQNRYKNTEELRTQLEAQLKVYYGKLIK